MGTPSSLQLVKNGEIPTSPFSPKNDYILPLLFPAIPKLPNLEDWEQISLDQLRAWDFAPSMALLLNKKTRSLSLTTAGSEIGEFHRNLLKSIGRGLTESEALASLTTNPAKICGVDQFCGTLEKENLLIFL